jgi:NADPH2:quinone reductase
MTNDQIRALIVTAPGNGDVLRVESRSLGAPGPGELLVAVAASGVNFIDVYQRQGVYHVPTPFVLGSEGAGTVTAIGADVVGFAVGEVVAWASVPASHASAILLPAERAVPVPAEVSPEIAAAVMLQGMTAHYLINSTYLVQPGDSVLVHAAAGGVGQLLVQLAKARGARVIGTVGSQLKADKAAALGADAVIRYDEVDDLAAAVRAANAGLGVSVVYDGVGRSTFDASLAALQPRGLLALFGGSSGQVHPFDVQRLNAGGSLFLTRPKLADYIDTREELLWRGTDILRAVADGTVQVEIGGRYKLEDAARAYDDLESRRTTGKLLLIPDQSVPPADNLHAQVPGAF